MSKKAAGGNRFKVVPGSVQMARYASLKPKKEVSTMSDKAMLDKEMADIKKRFEAEQAREKGLVEKRAELDRGISQCREEQIRLQGEYRAVEKLIAADAKPETETPS